jgi:hypothetical protein
VICSHDSDLKKSLFPKFRFVASYLEVYSSLEGGAEYLPSQSYKILTLFYSSALI